MMWWTLVVLRLIVSPVVECDGVELATVRAREDEEVGAVEVNVFESVSVARFVAVHTKDVHSKSLGWKERNKQSL